MKTSPAAPCHRAATVADSPTTATAMSPAPADSIALRQCGKVSMRPVLASTSVSSWCSQPGWFSSEPWWWSTLKTTALPDTEAIARARPEAR